MNKHALLLFSFLAIPPHITAGTASTFVEASTQVLFSPNEESHTHNMSSIGLGRADAESDSHWAGIQYASAFGHATASLGSLSFAGSVSSYRAGEGAVGGSAQYDYWIVFPGAVSGTITGEYYIHASTTNDQGYSGPFANWAISIGQGGSMLQVPASQFLTETAALTSSYTAGQSIEISGSAMGWAGNSYGNYNTYVSLQLVGFRDQTGNQLVFAEVPEPVLWPALLLCLTVICTRRTTQAPRQ